MNSPESVVRMLRRSGKYTRGVVAGLLVAFAFDHGFAGSTLGRVSGMNDGWAESPRPTSYPWEGALVAGTSRVLQTDSFFPSPAEQDSEFADVITPELQNLAESLANDPVRIFEWVRNNVQTEHYLGGNRGAHLTWLEQAGNDVDQCALLGTLFRAAGYAPTYRLGWVYMNRTATEPNQVGAYEWLAVEDDESVQSILRDRFVQSVSGYPFVFVYMWVSLDIPGKGTVRFWPSIKRCSVGRKPSLDSLTDYTFADATTSANATGAGAYSPAIDANGLKSYLSGLATTASNAIHGSSDLHDLDGTELARAPKIVPEAVTTLAPSDLRYPRTIAWDDSVPTPKSRISKWFVGHLRIKLGTNAPRFIETPRFMGKSLVCEFDANGVAILKLDGIEIERESSGTPSQNITIELGYEYPLAWFEGVSHVYGGSSSMLRQNTVAIGYGFGRTVNRLQKTLYDIAAKETATASSATLADRLQIIVQQYISQCHELARLGVAVLGQEHIRECAGGFAYLWQGNPVVDIKINTGAQRAKESGVPATASNVSAKELLTGALEGTAIEQLSGQRSFGTPTLFDYAMTQGRGFYLLDSTNYSTYVGSLQNFNDATLGAGALAQIQAAIADGRKIVALNNSGVTHGPVTFGGYYEVAENGGVGTHIKGALGGVTTGPVGTVPVTPQVTANPTSSTNTAQTQGIATSTDPVDLTNGAFLKVDTDLVLGTESEPNGLRLERDYNSARRLNDPVGLGRGFTHNYALKLTTRSPNDIDSQRVGVDEVLPVLIAARVAQDALERESSARAWQLATTAMSWAVEQQINSRASISLGARSIEFVRRPDGSYTAPGNLTATLTKQGDASHDLAFRHGNTIRFRASDGKFTSIKDQHGKTLNAVYDGSNRLRTVTDSYGRWFTFSYDGTGRLYTVTDSTGRNVQYGRNAFGHFTFTDPESKTQTLEWNSDFLLTRIRDALGRTVVENDYDAWNRVYQQRTFGEAGRLTKLWIVPGIGTEVDPTGAKVWTYFDARGRKIFVADQLNRLSTWEYDGVDRLVQTVSPSGAMTTYGYDANHVLVSETNPVGHMRTIVPDAQSRPWKVRNFEGNETIFTYTPQHKIETITAPGGTVTSFTYDARGRVLTEHPAAYAAGEVKTYAYDDTPTGFGNLDKVTFPADANTGDQDFDDYAFNARGDLVEFIDRKDVKTTFGYNARRQRTSVTLWDGETQRTTQTFYDAAGDVDYVLDASGRKEDFDYDALGHLLTIRRGPVSAQVTTLTNVYSDPRTLLKSTTDALGHVTNYTYHDTQQLAMIEDPLHRFTAFGYDSDQRQITVKTPLGLAASPNYQTTTLWDVRGLKDSVQDAEGQLTDYTYDRDGRLVELANRLSKPFTWAYDDANRIVISRTPRQQPGGPDAAKHTVETRNTRGLPESITEPSGQVTGFDTYDAEGRLEQKTDAVGTTAYTYWPNGLLKNVTESGITTYRGYDELNRLNEYRDGEGNTVTYQYHPSGELWKLTYPGNRTVVYTYDDFGRLWKVTDWSSRVTTYTYDDASRLTRIDRPNGTYRVQEYDEASQIRFIKEHRSDGTFLVFQEMRYDDDGRMTYLFRHPKPADITLAADALLYDDDNRLSTWNGQSVDFDYDGNMISGPLPSGSFGTYGYDARNRLISAGGSGYTYNPDGLRVAITGTGAVTFVIDPSAALSRTLIRTKGGTATYYVYGLGLLYEDTDGVTKTYHCDQVGSTLALTDANQNVTDRWSYAPFGMIASRTGSTDTPFQFNGELGVQTDPNGLLQMRNRYYNPRLMRFCNADPIKFDGGLNWYASFDNNPISKTDPLGLWGSDYHLDRTNALALAAGFSARDAGRIARADNNVDSVWLGKSFMPVVGNQGYHFNTNGTKSGAVDSRIAYSQIHLDKAISYQVKADNMASGGFFSRLLSGIFHSLAMSNLGKALHPAQDVSAHDANVTNKAAGVYYHAQDGSVDNIDKRPEAAQAADEATNAILKKFQEGTSAGGCRK